MVESSSIFLVKPIVRILSHSRISIKNYEPNNTKCPPGEVKQETVVTLSIDPKLSTHKSSNGNGTLAIEGSKKKQAGTNHFPNRVLRYVGIFLALMACIFISIANLIVKLMEGYDPVSKVIWRLQGILLPSLLIMLYVKFYQKRALLGKTSGWKSIWQIFVLLTLRGIVGGSADIFQYYSLKYLPLADSTVISFSTPIFVCLVAHFVLKEKCAVVPVFCSILTLCGVIVISKPPILTGEESMSDSLLVGNILAMLCMMCATLATVLVRYLSHTHFSVTMFALGAFGTMEGFVVSLFTSPFELPTINADDWMLAAIIAALYFLGQLSMTLGLQFEEAGVISLVRTCEVIFAFIWQVAFLHQATNIHSYIGAIIVILGVGLTALRKWLLELPEHHSIRQRLYFLLR